MGADIAGAIEEFLSLNGRFLGNELAGHERQRGFEVCCMRHDQGNRLQCAGRCRGRRAAGVRFRLIWLLMVLPGLLRSAVRRVTGPC